MTAAAAEGTPAGLIWAEKREASRPHLPDEAEVFWRAFCDLCGDRSYGMGAGPIPWGAFDRWAVRHGVFDPDEFAFVWSAIRALDAVWLDNAAKKREQQAKKGRS